MMTRFRFLGAEAWVVKVAANEVGSRVQVPEVVSGAPLRQATRRLHTACRDMHEAEPPRGQDAMVIVLRRERLSARVLQKQPTVLAAGFGEQAVATQERDGEPRQDLPVDQALVLRRGRPTSLADDVRSPGTQTHEPAHQRLVLLRPA
jgi:hypothetical protein